MKRKSSDGCLRAFTVHPGWAWAIMKGVKTQEWRTFLPNPREESWGQAPTGLIVFARKAGVW